MKKNNFKNLKSFLVKHKLRVSVFIILIIIFLILLYIFFSKKLPSLIQKNIFENQVLSFAENNQNSVFSINQITLFSSCDAKNKIGSKTNFTIENLYAYTDIAIFINQTSEDNSLENTLKEVSIKNISFNNAFENGQAKLFYKNLNDFTKPYIPDKNEITDGINFNITSEENADFSEPTLYNNCANPITLSYIHENIKSDYTITDTSIPITYNGSLLKRCAVPISSITNNLSFDIFITNNKDEKFKSKVFIPITYRLDDKSIYDGNITIKQDVNFVFYRYE